VAVGYHRHREIAGQVAQEIRGRGAHALAVGFDVVDAAGTEAAVRGAGEELGGLDVVVHAAAQNVDGLAADLAPQDLARVLSVNVAGAFHVTSAALPFLLSSGRGRVIHFSSVLARRANTGAAAYAATKGAIEALTRALAVELGSKGITVNAVAPGYVHAGLGSAPVEAAGENLRAMIPLRRPGSPEEIARVVLFLASEDASYITGSVLTVDGGLLAGGRFHPIPRTLEARS
jgi:3-oxoacyl-[acyl-carrier protein] reductase